MPVVLWTDALVWLIVVAIVCYALYARKREHLVNPWRRVVRSGAAMAALVVLSAFVTVGLLDSLHFRARLPSAEPRAEQGAGKSGVSAGSAAGMGAKTTTAAAYSVEVSSVLDALLGGIKTRTERTYSAPFALHLHQKETIELGGGRVERIYPRLRHGGAHLADEQAFGEDVALRVLQGVGLAFILWWLAAMFVTQLVARNGGRSVRATWQAIWSGATVVRWRAAFTAAAVLLMLAVPIFMLATKYHVFGTDKVGQDVFYQSLKSIRTALVIGTVTTLVTLPLGVLLGTCAGYFRGWVDDVIQYIYTTINSIPSVLLIVAAVLMMQVVIEKYANLFPTTAERADIRLLVLCVILGLTSWTGLARLLRGEALKLRELEYIQAARAFGVSAPRTIVRHILPNTMHIVLIALVMEFSSLVLAEAVLSYIGVGVDPTMVSFGTMINQARLEMAREPMVWWSLAAAFCFMFTLVLAANLLADAVRDAFDPRTVVGAIPVAGKAAA